MLTFADVSANESVLLDLAILSLSHTRTHTHTLILLLSHIHTFSLSNSLSLCLLGAWVAQQRRRFKHGTLSAKRIRLMEEAGVEWALRRGNHNNN
jgi:hypothetical protein